MTLVETASSGSPATGTQRATVLPRTQSTTRLRSVSGTIARRAIVPVGLIALWQLAAEVGWLSAHTLAPPSAVWTAFADLAANGQLLPNIGVSLGRVAAGSAIGIAAGTLFGLVAGLSRFGEELVDAPLQMLRTLPFLGMLPLLMVWLGIGEGLKIGLVALGVVFPVYLNLHKGIRGVDPRFGELADSLGVNRWGLIRGVILPGALPSFLVGLRFALGIGWLSLVVGETVNADQGIGYLMMRARDFMQTDVIVLGLVIYSLLGLLVDGLVRLLEWRFLPWRREFTNR